MMPEAIHIVHLEDDARDMQVVRDCLLADGLACEWVTAASGSAFEAAIEGRCDVVLADSAVPGFDGADALRLSRARRPDVPFIFVSDTMGEEAAVERIKQGAKDCVLKDRLSRLPGAVRRALAEEEGRRHRGRLEAEVRRLNAELERRVEERTAQLEAANLALQRRQAELAEAKGFLENLVAASPSMVFRMDPETFAMTYVSPNIGWLLGYSDEEATAASGFWATVIHPDDRDRIVSGLQRAVTKLVAQVEGECRCRAKDGRYRPFFMLLRIEYDAEARPTGVLGYALDIGDRKAAEEQLREAHDILNLMFEHLPAIVFVKDARELRYVQFNRAGEELLGLSRRDVIGRTDSELFPPEVAREYVQLAQEVLRSGRVVDVPEMIVFAEGGAPRVIHSRMIPIIGAAGEPLYVLGVAQDITERREAHEEVRLARREAERASRAKSEFLSRMSHELRTPLNAVLGFAQILEMDRLTPDQADSVEQILRGGVLLLDLINEVLDIARIETGQLTLSPEPVSVAEVVTQVVDLVRPLAASKRIRVYGEGAHGGLHVRADRQRLRQVLLNLVSNAVKYNRDGGQVRVAAESTGELVRIGVADTGAGIPPEKLTLLFEPFERLGAEQSGIEGTGLGLAVSKGLTEAMGGRILVDSRVDIGTTFWVDLPAAPAPAPRLADAMPAPAVVPMATGTILYVEDNRSNVRLLERLLARRPGVRLLTAGTGQGALDQVQRERPDLVLLDLHLPDIMGEEVLRRLWADPETRSIPVAVLSADATPRQQQRLLAAGAVAYLTKPLDVPALLRVIDERLAAREDAS